MSITPYLPLIAALIAILVAQLVKIPINFFTHLEIDWRRAISTGGMPSSHSAAVAALTTGVGMKEGFSSSLFAIAFVFGVITMYDAAGVRRHAGTHASLLNRITRRLAIEQNDNQKLKYPLLKEMLGHRPIEVLAGAVLGIIISLLLWLAFA
ncbi:divergent PAP2 family protein [Paenibacillus sp. OV219]|uniref:divergent PAP2 family protein n=1 Tax=Paenibacillus sp. OV219 TaxID=1884377 RepID=UPI0008C620D6|nr:divergent PAP2 family protein [Paenibacillus sp. OV219]SEM54282.1 hypothetical protein SAMN05518847_101109 [Paenibacillus sp. OV219]